MHPFPMASVFTAGMRRDADRTMLPGGAVWNLVDFIPDEIQAAASGRGGWTYAGGSMVGLTGVEEIGYWQDTSNPSNSKVLIAGNDGKLWNPITATSIGTLPPSGFAASPPFFHRGKLIFPNGLFGGGAASTAYYDGTTIGTISAITSGEQISVGCVYKDHAVLANTSQGVQRVLFSAAGDPTTWDTSFGWWDTSGVVTALITLPNALLVCHPDSTERLRGTTPPPGSDMVLEPFLNVGCIDPHSVAYWQNSAIFAAANGIYMTDGAGSVDLTAEAGIKSYWQSLLSGYTSPGLGGGYSSTYWRIAGGIYRDHYIISINNGSTLVDCLCINLNDRAAWRFSNLHGACFLNVQVGQQEKLYMPLWNAGRVAELSSIWGPAAGVKQDADGTNPTPIIETGDFRGYDRLHRRWIQSMGKQKWRFAYLDYDLRDAASDNPTVSLTYAPNFGSSYAATAEGNLPASTGYLRKRRSLSKTRGGATRSNNMGFKIAVNGPYASANVFTLEVDFSPVDIGRVG